MSPLKLASAVATLSFILSPIRSEAPIVHSDNSVTFTFSAPNADSVEIDVKGKTSNANDRKPFPMTKSKDGRWTYTSEPLDPGFHYYLLYVNGAKVADNRNPLYFGWARPTNGIEIPDPDLDIYLPRNVPRGEIRLLPYYSSLTQSGR